MSDMEIADNQGQEDNVDEVEVEEVTDDKVDKKRKLDAHKVEMKRKYNKIRQTVKRAEEANLIETFKLPSNKNNVLQVHNLYPDNVGDIDWNGRARDGTLLSREVRVQLVMVQDIHNYDARTFEVPHFGRDDDALILKSKLTVHQATAIVSNHAKLFAQHCDDKIKIEALEKKVEEQGKMILKLQHTATTQRDQAQRSHEQVETFGKKIEEQGQMILQLAAFQKEHQNSKKEAATDVN
jgi:hypothetical protein